MICICCGANKSGDQTSQTTATHLSKSLLAGQGHDCDNHFSTGRLQLVGLVLAACPTTKNGIAVTRDYQASAS